METRDIIIQPIKKTLMSRGALGFSTTLFKTFANGFLMFSVGRERVHWERMG